MCVCVPGLGDQGNEGLKKTAAMVGGPCAADKVNLDLDIMMKQKESSVSGLTKGIEGLFKKNKVTYIKGTGKITGKGELTVDLLEGGTEKVTTKNIVIATGSEPTELPFLKVCQGGEGWDGE